MPFKDHLRQKYIAVFRIPPSLQLGQQSCNYFQRIVAHGWK